MTPTPPAAEVITDNVRRALTEDIGTGDVTAALLPAGQVWQAEVVTREAAIVSGAPWFQGVYAALDTAVAIQWLVDDGERADAGQTICRLGGPARSLVTGERTALNFLQTLSGTATAARRFADAVAGTETRVLDTRKTLPGLRSAQKYAVACGGCHNHRMGLFDAILIKENHILACGSITAAVRLARHQNPELSVEVEVESLEELDEAITAGADRVMLDNFTPPNLRRAVERARGAVSLEISGDVALEDMAALAATGVDYISTGALTKHVQAIDLSMRFSAERGA